MQTTYAQKNDADQNASDNTADSVVDSSSQSAALQRHASLANGAVQRVDAPRPNNTGMPDNLKSGIESLSGFSMDDVRVHYNSSKPATVQALAYTQGTDIHVAPGQEKCLPHEAWHVAQQMAGRVSPTTNVNGMPVNDNAALEHEADVMGEKAVQCKTNDNLCNVNFSMCGCVQCMKVQWFESNENTKPKEKKNIKYYNELCSFINGKNKNSEIKLGKENRDEIKRVKDQMVLTLGVDWETLGEKIYGTVWISRYKKLTGLKHAFVLFDKQKAAAATPDAVVNGYKVLISREISGCSPKFIEQCANHIYEHKETTGGGTGYTVDGKTVFHISQGNKQQKGNTCTVFFIHENESKKTIVGVGKHVSDTSYKLHWGVGKGDFVAGNTIFL